MKLIFASDSFKGSLSSKRTAELLTKAAQEVFGACKCVGVSVADGGEGTVDAVIEALHGERVTATVHDPLMRTLQASYGVAGKKAIVETAAASGLTLLTQSERDPLMTTTFGTGELIRDALDRGCRELYIAIGGSATNDGGMGCLRALGAVFFDANGSELIGCGRDLSAVTRIDLTHLDSRLSDASVTVLCDVKNPLCGENGATYTFSKQKGATPDRMAILESGMQNYRDVIRRRFGVDCDMIEGAGAAGGLGAALRVFLNAAMQSGIETVLDLIRFDELLDGADLVVTGEGRADAQSVCGKVMQGVALHAKKKKIPVYGLCGSLADGAELLRDCGVSSLYSLVDENTSVEEAMTNAEEVYYRAAVRMFSRIKGDEKMKYLDCISVDNMRESDRLTIERYVSGRTLMYRAAMGVFRAVNWRGDIAIAVGGGNNGGDGYALACILKRANFSCRIVKLSEKLTGDSGYFAKQAERLGVPSDPYASGAFADADIIVDCLLGTGFQGSLRDSWLSAVTEINNSSAAVVSVDINSGMNGDTGAAKTAVRSDITVTIGYVKRGLVSANAARYMKRLVVADIGIILAKEEEKIVPADVYENAVDSSVIPAPDYLSTEPIDVSREENIFD